jgi:uncharacterized membrane protein
MNVATLLGDPVLSAALAGCFALILFAAAWHKFAEPLMFQAAVEAYRLLPGALAPVFARLLPVAEVLLGIALLLPATRGIALALFALLMAVYAMAMAINLLRGRSQIDCGCGAEVHFLSWALVARNAVLALLALVAAGPSVTRELQWLDAVTLIGGALALYAAYLLFDELLRQHGRIVQLRARKAAA